MNDELAWRKSSFSDDQGGACVEVAGAAGVAYVRDSKIVSGPQLRLTAAAWGALVSAAIEPPKA